MGEPPRPASPSELDSARPTGDDPLRYGTRGAAVSLLEPLPAAPTVMHYEPGPVTYRQFDRAGRPWLAIYEAEHDGIGWLVVRARCRPLVLMPGDCIHVRCHVDEDQGDIVLVRFDESQGMAVRRPVPRKSVVFIEEAPPSVPG